MWVDIANAVQNFASVPGNHILNTWIYAANNFNVDLEHGDQEQAIDMLYQANSSFGAVAKYIINNVNLSNYFTQIYQEFGAILDTEDFVDINNYMIAAYPQFKKLLGC